MTYDVVVYGGTPSGVAASLAAARRGMKVAMVAEGGTVGGMMSNGLSASDIGSKGPIKGIAREVFERIDSFYQGQSAWRVEPHAAERIFRDMLDEAGVYVGLNSRVVSAERSGREVLAVRTESEIFYGRTFVDASYPGDLFSTVGCHFRLGMADIQDYDESLASKRAITKIQDIDASDDVAKANPFVKIQGRRQIKDGMPSITYRLCLAKDGRAKEIEPGARYPEQVKYFRALLAGYIKRDSDRAERLDVKSNGTLHSAYYQLARIPQDKFDLNSGWASFTNVTTTPAYFINHENRTRHHAEVEELVRNFFRFLQVDPRVPASVRGPFESFGLAGDEFADNDFWPYEPYLREGRRIVGRYTLTQRDIFVNRRKVGGVAIGSYPVDSKLTQLILWRGALYRDIGPHMRVPLYEIPYWCMLPAKGPSNLLVTVGLSASPVAYGSVRLEPQFLALGEAAGVASAIAVTRGRSVYDLPPSDVQEALLETDSLVRVVIN